MNEIASVPAWHAIVANSKDWQWKGNLLHETGSSEVWGKSHGAKPGLASLVVSHIYGRQNQSRPVKQVMAKALSELKPGDYGLNFGSGSQRYADNLLNLDLEPGPNADVVSAGSLRLPFIDDSLRLIVCQEVLEHVDRPTEAIAEFHRTLKPDGALVLQLPFIIGYHPGPTDFWRFSKEAYAKILPEGQWAIEDMRITVGHGSALHRILTEFVAVHFSIFGKKIYRLAKGISTVLLFPLVLFDFITAYLPEKDRIPGGYIVVARPKKKR